MRRTSALPTLLLAGALLLTGCGGGDDGTAEASGNGSGSGSSSSDGSSSGDEPTSNDSGDGADQPQVEMGSLPDDFPSDDVPLAAQVKLLRVLQTRTVERVGGFRPVPIDVRFVAGSKRDLKQLVHDGKQILAL